MDTIVQTYHTIQLNLLFRNLISEYKYNKIYNVKHTNSYIYNKFKTKSNDITTDEYLLNKYKSLFNAKLHKLNQIWIRTNKKRKDFKEFYNA